MSSSAICNDFRKAMSATVFTAGAGAALADAERLIERGNTLKRGNAQEDMALVLEFCRLLLRPIDEVGPGFAEISGFAETYCRRHLSSATGFLRQVLATRETDSPACKRLIHIASLIEIKLKHYLDEETAIRCWFGDKFPLGVGSHTHSHTSRSD